MRNVLAVFGRALVKVLTLPGLQALGFWFGSVMPWPMSYGAWDEPVRWVPGAPDGTGRLVEPPPLHPERVRDDLPLTELELRLSRELSAVSPEWPAR
ncbi:hypothetical protein JK361_19840 [Streptomyces sp. 5-8]|uniref:Uncharacterized protein n=1 Tax=Streptomyces musisoli TaxID=2802280 RepID=A0ABS1P3E5_9ACTN|nr:MULTISPECIES: DUF6059 family protein [Streptomyces]MBL1106828.1 hypothetical protein [Streptomyces musisoli]MBY8842188.1 hypothetical protein [Streptomyces sp. SP2-10]